jgi:predicted permease
VIVQVSGSLVLLVLAAQSYSGLSHDIRRNLGFRSDHVLMMSFDTSLVRDTPSRRDRFYQLLPQRARETPGVRAVALASTIPTGVTPAFEPVIPEPYQFPPGQQSVSVWTNVVDENYFRVLGVPVIRGREFLPSDGPEAQPVAIVNDTFARRLLKNQPLGKRIRLGPNSPWIEVVGVTATGKYLSPLESPMEALYLPLRQRPESHITMLALTATNPSNLAAPLADVVRSIDPNMPVFGVRSMSDYFEQRSVKTGNLVVETIAGAGLLGFVLALVGLYAVVAWHVAGRRREIGVRIAIGADMGKIVLMILAQSARMSVTGIVLGIAVAALIGQRLSSSPLHLEINYLWMAAIALALLTTSLIAAAIPARRASRIDPARALRQE